MALPVANLVKDAIETIFDAFNEDPTRPGSRAGVDALSEAARAVSKMYDVVNVAITDATDAGVAELIASGGELEDYAIGVVFRTTGGTADLTDDALETAKGSAVATGDVFVVDDAASVKYLGNNSGHAIDAAGETSQDFIDV